MPISLILVSLWVLIACLIGLGPQKYHWPAAWVLIAFGIPLTGFVTLQLGAWWGLGVLVAGMSILRWPVFYAGRWMRQVLTRSG